MDTQSDLVSQAPSKLKKTKKDSKKRKKLKKLSRKSVIMESSVPFRNKEDSPETALAHCDQGIKQDAELKTEDLFHEDISGRSTDEFRAATKMGAKSDIMFKYDGKLQIRPIEPYEFKGEKEHYDAQEDHVQVDCKKGSDDVQLQGPVQLLDEDASRGDTIRTGRARTFSHRKSRVFANSFSKARRGSYGEVLVVMVAFEIVMVNIVVVAGLYLASFLMPKPTIIEGFCCKTEAEALAEVVNLSVPPCESFYRYVCLKALKHDLRTPKNFRNLFEKDIAAGIASSSSAASRGLVNIYKSCSTELGQSDIHLLQEAVRALIEMNIIKANMSYNEIVEFLFAITFKYSSESMVSMIYTIRGQSPLLQIFYLPTEKTGPLFAAIIDIFNEMLRTNVTQQEIETFRHNYFNHSTRNCDYNHGDISFLKTIFPAFPEKGMKEILTQFLWIDGKVGVEFLNVSTYCLPRITEMVLILGDPSHQPLATAFLVAQSAIRTARKLRFYERGALPEETAAKMCQLHLDRMMNIWDALFTEMLTSIEKDAHIRLVHGRVVSAIASDNITSVFFENDDLERANRMLQNLTVILPSETQPPRKVPDMTSSYPRNYFQAHLYEFLANKYKHKRNWMSSGGNYPFPITVIPNDTLMVSPTYYDQITLRGNWSLFLNMPTLGMKLATMLWEYLLYNVTWSTAARIKLDDFKNCFREEYLRGRQPNRIDNATIAMALALSSIRKSLPAQAEWNLQRQVSERFKISLSHGQFFYLRQAYSLCPSVDGEEYADCINAPARYVTDFATTFKCKPKDDMRTGVQCAPL